MDNENRLEWLRMGGQMGRKGEEEKKDVGKNKTDSPGHGMHFEVEGKSRKKECAQKREKGNKSQITSVGEGVRTCNPALVLTWDEIK